MRFPARPPSVDLAALPAAKLRRVLEVSAPALPDGRYLHWDELRRRVPPAGLTGNQWWTAVKLARQSVRSFIPGFTAIDGTPFWYSRTDIVDRATHELDRRDAAREMLRSLGDAGARHAYRAEQMMEEAINSSVLEGARLTTRAQARAVIRQGRAPVSKGERMVVNNYRAMQALLDLAGGPLTLDHLLQIHATLGDEALDAANAAGRLRTAGEVVRVEDAVSGDVWFTPPPAVELPERLAALLTFANDSGTASQAPFIHPLVRAIVLHFWLAYLHPFVDGNGRLARALFYWQMLRSGYDFAQYLSISGPIDRAPRAYYLAFAHSETDGGDLTYFLLHQLRVLRRATDDLISHLRDRAQRLQSLTTAALAGAVNDRQRAILERLLREPQEGITIAQHARDQKVTYLTARKDLQGLESAGHLRRVQAGRGHRYHPVPGLAARLLPDG